MCLKCLNIFEIGPNHESADNRKYERTEYTEQSKYMHKMSRHSTHITMIFNNEKCTNYFHTLFFVSFSFLVNGQREVSIHHREYTALSSTLRWTLVTLKLRTNSKIELECSKFNLKLTLLHLSLRCVMPWKSIGHLHNVTCIHNAQQLHKNFKYFSSLPSLTLLHSLHFQ